MKHTLCILITAHTLIAASSCSAMEITIRKPKSIAFPEDDTVVVGGKGGCGIFNSKSQNLIHQFTTNNIIHLVANNHIVAFINSNTLTFCYGKTGVRKWAANFMEPSTPLALKNDILFTYRYLWLKSFNYTEQTTSTIRISNGNEFYKDTLISYHPKTNAMLYCTNRETLSIAQLNSDYPIKMHLNTNLTLCKGGEYNADGTTIVFSDDHHKYFIYNLLDTKNSAYELSANDKKYVAATFHPFIHLLALLSHDNIIQYWDYLSRKLVATTYALADNVTSKINKYKTTKRLAFSPNGSQLAIALKRKWTVIDTPKNNNSFAMIYYLLRINQMPKELINTIMQHIIERYALSQINCAALSRVVPILLFQHTEIYQQQNTEYRDIEIIYSNKNS